MLRCAHRTHLCVSCTVFTLQRGARSERAVKGKDQTATNNSGDLEEYSQACSLQRAVKTAKGQDRDRGESIHTCGPAWEPQTADYEKPVNRALLHFYQIHRTRFGTSLHVDSNLICVDPESYGIPGCVLKVCAEQFLCVFIFHTSRLPSVVLSTRLISFRFLEVYLTLDLSWTHCININNWPSYWVNSKMVSKTLLPLQSDSTKDGLQDILQLLQVHPQEDSDWQHHCLGWQLLRPEWAISTELDQSCLSPELSCCPGRRCASKMWPISLQQTHTTPVLQDQFRQAMTVELSGPKHINL